MNKISHIKGVIFDLDGVLVDSERLHYLAWIKVLEPVGINLSIEEFSAFAGKQIDIVAEELIKKYKIDLQKTDLVLERRKAAIEIFERAVVRPIPYAKEALEFFANCKKIKMAVASGGIRKIVDVKLKRAGFSEFFSVVVAGDEVKNGKPHPESYLLAVKNLKLKPEECLSFEDTQYGLESAKSAGLICFAIPSEYSRHQDFSRADKVFKNLKNAVDYIKNQNLC